jgi:hypothetical protein
MFENDVAHSPVASASSALRSLSSAKSTCVNVPPPPPPPRDEGLVITHKKRHSVFAIGCVSVCAHHICWRRQRLRINVSKRHQVCFELQNTKNKNLLSMCSINVLGGSRAERGGAGRTLRRRDCAARRPSRTPCATCERAISLLYCFSYVGIE